MPPKLQSTRRANESKPIVRAQNSESAPLRVPTPEELGLGKQSSVRDQPIDWAMVERRLDTLGATSFHLEKTTSGFRFDCELPSGKVTGLGTSKGEAVRNALAKVQN
jgi:hypothetical protein